MANSNKSDRLNDHEKFLKRMGVTPELLRMKLYDKNGNRKGVHEIPDYKVKSTAPLSNSIGNGFKKSNNVYTGDEIMGVATLHKSNAVPVRKGTDNAKEISRMRRG